jgi:L,D-transpeptidase ErfK/SrfK
MAITHGCIRMYPEDIEALFPLVPVNTPVWLINEPVKVARVNGQVWLEVHPPVDAEGQKAEIDLEGFYALANSALGETPAAIHWDIVLETLKKAEGMPQMVGLEIDPADLPPGFSTAPAPPLPAEAQNGQQPPLPAEAQNGQQPPLPAEAPPQSESPAPAEPAPPAPTDPAKPQPR